MLCGDQDSVFKGSVPKGHLLHHSPCVWGPPWGSMNQAAEGGSGQGRTRLGKGLEACVRGRPREVQC